MLLCVTGLTIIIDLIECNPVKFGVNKRVNCDTHLQLHAFTNISN